jgi:acetyltransferase
MSNSDLTGVLSERAVTASRFAAEQAVTEVLLHDETRVLIRPIHPGDVALERRFIEALSPTARRYRFLDTMRTPSEALLKLLTEIKPATDVAYVAVLGAGDAEVEIGVARFSALPDGANCEFAVTVADEWQNKGLGTFLMERLIAAAKARGLESMFSSDASDNTRMRQFAEHLHFHHMQDPDDARLVRYSVDLK